VLPAVIPLLLVFCFVCIPFASRLMPVYAWDHAVVTRIREYYPKDEILPETELYYPQISFGGNPSQLQTANAMMREYAVRQYQLYRKTGKSGTLPAAQEEPVVLADYQILRNSGGYLSVQFRSINASLASPGWFTIRLSDRRVCRLADLFTSDTDYCSLLNRELSRRLQEPFDRVRFDTPFCLTEDSLLLLFWQEDGAPVSFEVPLSDLSPQRLQL